MLRPAMAQGLLDREVLCACCVPAMTRGLQGSTRQRGAELRAARGRGRRGRLGSGRAFRLGYQGRRGLPRVQPAGQAGSAGPEHRARSQLGSWLVTVGVQPSRAGPQHHSQNSWGPG